MAPRSQGRKHLTAIDGNEVRDHQVPSSLALPSFLMYRNWRFWHSLEWEELSPLRDCPNLEKIVISLSYGVQDLADFQLGNMARSFPRQLRSLAFESPNECMYIDIPGLDALAQYCTKLAKLQIGL